MESMEVNTRAITNNYLQNLISFSWNCSLCIEVKNRNKNGNFLYFKRKL